MKEGRDTNVLCLGLILFVLVLIQRSKWAEYGQVRWAIPNLNLTLARTRSELKSEPFSSDFEYAIASAICKDRLSPSIFFSHAWPAHMMNGLDSSSSEEELSQYSISSVKPPTQSYTKLLGFSPITMRYCLFLHLFTHALNC